MQLGEHLAPFQLKGASRGPSAIAELLVVPGGFLGVASNLLIYLRINITDHSFCQIIGPAAAGSDVPVPTPVR